MQDGQSPTIINLHGTLSVERSSSLKDELGQALEEQDTVLISISLVEEIDLACLQVFYAAKAQAAAEGKELRFIGSVPSRVTARLATCGFLRRRVDSADDLESALVGF